jgi:hypothetical protein
VAFYIEAVLLAIIFVMIIAKKLSQSDSPAQGEWRATHGLSSKLKLFWAQHSEAVSETATVFLDVSVYFSLSISFAGILFNYRDKPILYEDKLGQTSSLLAIDAPVSILLLIYTEVKKRRLRYALVAVASLMVFIIQFLYRRASTFIVATSGCLDWRQGLQIEFEDLFIVKAVWGLLVALFFFTHYMFWYLTHLASSSSQTIDWVT